MNTPDDASDDTINELWEQDGGAVEAGPLNRLFRGLGIDDKLPPIPSVQPIDVMPVKLSSIVYERCPVGHDIGWMCYDENKHDGPESDVGIGLTQDEAYAHYLDLIDEEPEEQPKPRASRVIYHSQAREEPDEYAPGSHQDWEDDDRE